MVDYYSGQEAPSLKMGSVFLFVRFLSFFFGIADFALWMLIGLRPDDTFFVVSRTAGLVCFY